MTCKYDKVTLITIDKFIIFKEFVKLFYKNIKRL